MNKTKNYSTLQCALSLAANRLLDRVGTERHRSSTHLGSRRCSWFKKKKKPLCYLSFSNIYWLILHNLFVISFVNFVLLYMYIFVCFSILLRCMNCFIGNVFLVSILSYWIQLIIMDRKLKRKKTVWIRVNRRRALEHCQFVMFRLR